MDWISANWEHIIAIISALVALSSVIVKLTPTPDDDTFLAKIIDVLDVLNVRGIDKTKNG